jgi:hypothetical protein
MQTRRKTQRRGDKEKGRQTAQTKKWKEEPEKK